jgi:hypothetical protein
MESGMRTKPPEFGKRGRQTAKVEPKPTVMERLKKAASRFWAKKSSHKKKAAHAKGVRR